MKKTVLIVLLAAVTFTCTLVALPLSASASTAAQTPLANDVASFIKDDVVLQVNDDFEIYGNVADMSEADFEERVATGDATVYLHYRTDKSIDMRYDALLIICSGKQSAYEYSEQLDVSSSKLAHGIRNFAIRYIDKTQLAAPAAAPAATNDSDIPQTFVGSIVDREYVVNFDDVGYITYHIGVTRYVANSKSILYIVTVNNAFVPGIVANQNGDTSYKKYNNMDGYVHMTVEQAFDRNEETYYGIRYGTIPYKKDYWPLNQPATVTITSSIQAGLTLGYSYTNGFSLSDLFEVEEGHSVGTDISYEYSKAITQPDPSFSAQVSASNPDECQWNYYCNTSTDKTCHLQTNYMFEMANERRDMFIGDFRLKLDYSFHLQRKVMLIFPQNKTYTHSADLFVQAGEYQSIRNFNNGII